MNDIHPTAVIEDCVEMGEDNYIGPFCYFTGKVEIGNNNRFEAYCSIGSRAEHTEYWDFHLILLLLCFVAVCPAPYLQTHDLQAYRNTHLRRHPVNRLLQNNWLCPLAGPDPYHHHLLKNHSLLITFR